MSVPKSKKLKARPYITPELDIPEFTLLMEMMRQAFNRHDMHAAKAMGVSYKTWMKWYHSPPSWPYYNVVMIHIITARLRGLNISRKGFTQDQYWYFRQALAKLKSGTQIQSDIEDAAVQAHGAEEHLRDLLAQRGMYWDQIRLPAHSGGYSPARLQRAAKAVGVIKTQEGFGTDKRSWWELPTRHD